jgi:hypothetical protein
MVKPPRHWRTILAWALLLIAATAFVRRGVTKAGDRLWDFGIIYTSARAWLVGDDPYAQDALVRRWADAGGAPHMPTDLSWLPAVVAPPTLVAMAPLAALDPPAARWGWLAISAASVATLIGATLRLADVSSWPARPTTLLLVAWVLGLGPLHIGMLAGQPALPAAALIAAGVACALSRRDVAAGVLFGLAAAFKLQLGVPFVLLYAYLCRWRVAGAGAIVFALFIAIGLGRIAVAGIEREQWTAHWRTNLDTAHGAGGPNDYSAANYTRYHLLNLQLPLHAITHSRTAANAGAAAIFIALGLTFVRHTWRPSNDLSPRAPDELLAAAVVAVLCLLPVYHRYYDAAVLVVPIAWAARHARGGDPLAWPARITGAILLTFLAPLAVAHLPVRRGLLPTTIDANPLWNALVVPHHVYGLLALAGVLLYAMRRAATHATSNVEAAIDDAGRDINAERSAR